MVIKQKCLPQVFAKVIEGKKNSAIYVGSTPKVGDTIAFEEINENGKYTGQKIKKKIVRVSRSSENHLYWTEEDKKHGFTILFFE